MAAKRRPSGPSGVPGPEGGRPERRPSRPSGVPDSVGAQPRRRASGPGKGPERLGSIISKVLQSSEREHRPLHIIQREWTGLVGKALAEHTKPVSLRHGRLMVHVDQPGDGFALNYQRARLLKLLRMKTGCTVEEIVIRAGEM